MKKLLKPFSLLLKSKKTFSTHTQKYIYIYIYKKRKKNTNKRKSCTCYICNGEGHYAPQCHRKGKGRNKMIRFLEDKIRFC